MNPFAKLIVGVPTESLQSATMCAVSTVRAWKRGDSLPKARDLDGIARACAIPLREVREVYAADKEQRALPADRRETSGTSPAARKTNKRAATRS